MKKPQLIQGVVFAPGWPWEGCARSPCWATGASESNKSGLLCGPQENMFNPFKNTLHKALFCNSVLQELWIALNPIIKTYVGIQFSIHWHLGFPKLAQNEALALNPITNTYIAIQFSLHWHFEFPKKAQNEGICVYLMSNSVGSLWQQKITRQKYNFLDTVFATLHLQSNISKKISFPGHCFFCHPSPSKNNIAT